MPRALNLEAIRRWTGAPASIQNANASDSGSQDFVARRTVLKVGGLTGVATLAGLGESWALPSVRFDGDSRRFAFKLGSREAWVIEPARFAGEPRLSIRRDRRRLRLGLKGAHFPGTAIPADFYCECREDVRGWSIALRMLGGRFRAGDRLEPWLGGVQPLRAHAFLDGDLLRSRARDLRLIAEGAAEVRFFPEWRFQAIGSGLAQASVPHGSLAIDYLDWRLPDDDAASVLTDPDARRTLLGVGRGAQTWRPFSGVQSLETGALTSGANPFDALRFEAEEASAKPIRIAMLAVNDGPESGITFHPGERVRDTGGNPLGLPLRDVRYSVNASESGSEEALLGRLGGRPVWLDANGTLLQLGDPADGYAFEWLAESGQTRSLVCAPALLRTYVSLGDAVTHPMETPAHTRVALTRQASVADGPPSLSEFSVRVIRPEDLLELQFTFHNLALRTRPFGPAQLERVGRAEPYVIVTFPPQAIAEQVFPENSALESQQGPCPPVTVKSRLSGMSRLAFKLRKDLQRIPFTLKSLLDWSQLEPVETAWPPPTMLDEPEALETAIEVPYRLLVAPLAGASWRHSEHAVARKGRTELWHTRLAPEPGDVGFPRVAAIWTPDRKTAPPNIKLSLTPENRKDIVKLSYGPTHPRPAEARLLLLSSLGAWTEFEGRWPAVEGVNNALEKWTHSMTMGREHHVVIEERGYLVPFGHRATLVTETERRIQEVVTPNGEFEYVTYLMQHQFLRIQEPVRAYARWDMPYTVVRIVEDKSPWLDEPISLQRYFLLGRCLPIPGRWPDAFWPRVAGEPFRFTIEALDRVGNTNTFKSAVMFLKDGEALGPDKCKVDACPLLHDVRCDWLHDPAHRSALNAQTLAMASSFRKGDTEIEGRDIGFDVEIIGYSGPGVVPFRPRLEDVNARVPSLMQYVQGGEGLVRLQVVDPDATGNAPEIFATLADGKLQAAFHEQGERSGGISAPTPSITHLSRRYGPVGADQAAVADFTRGTSASLDLDPKTFFDDSARLLGQIPLRSIIDAFDLNATGSVPALLSTLIPWADGPNELAQTFDWSTKELKEFTIPPFFVFTPRGELSIAARFQAWPGSELAPEFSIDGGLTDFDVKLDFGIAGLLVLFNGASFHASSTGGTQFAVDIKDVDFLGALAFVRALREFMNKFQKETGVEIEISPKAVRVGLPPIKVPNITLGMFSLEQLSITSFCRLPFDPQPIEFGFDFARRDSPCILGVGPYAGTAFISFVLAADQTGLRYFAAALEFGAMKSLDFGPAKGRLYVMGGLYYEMDRRSGYTAVAYRAYLRAGGQVEALGLITMSVELYLALTAGESATESYLIGTATMSYSFEIAFVKKSFSITYSQRFKGSDTGRQQMLLLSVAPAAPEMKAACPKGSLPFVTVMPSEQWETYWRAFA